MLTAHERLTARKVLICPPHCRASARKSRCALWLRPRPARSAFASPTPASTSAEARVGIARFVPTSPTQYPQNPSSADRNPIGRSPRPSQTPATYFKRPYRNCPGEESCAQPRLIGQGSLDRDLLFAGTYLAAILLNE